MVTPRPDTILWLGAGPGAPWHPFAAVEAEVRGALAGVAPLEVSLDVGRLEALEGVGLLVCCADAWKEVLTDGQTGGLLAYAARGGAVLVVHNGICHQGRPEFHSLVGAKFTGHPDAATLEFRSAAPEHPICRGAPLEWTLDEEPYRFELAAPAALTPLYEYKHEGAWYPAGWTSKFGQGTVVYLMPGHTAASFANPAYRAVLASAARWLLSGSPL